MTGTVTPTDLSGPPAPTSRPPTNALRRIIEEGFATGDTSVVDEVCSHDLVEHQFGLAGVGADAIRNLKAAIVDVHAMVPDIQFAIEDVAESGDRVWMRMRAWGTASGPFFGPPSGRPVEISVIDIARVVDGLIVEHWGVPDRFAMLAQTGVLDRLVPSDGGSR